MTASIVTIGDEILIGQIIDSNSAYIANELNNIGIELVEIVSISDKKEAIVSTINRLFKVSELIITTGGLGPTNDDITKQTLVDYFNTRLVFNEATYDKIKDLLDKRGVPVNERNRNQAMVPESCKLLENEQGTAPGMWFIQNNKSLISLPGVPFEMKTLIKDKVVPELKHASDRRIIHKTVLTQGIPESKLAEQIENWENNLPEQIKLAYLPSPGKVRLRLTARGTDDQALNKLLRKEIEKLQLIIPEAIFGYDSESLEEVIGKLLTQNKCSLATAESCTGGTIASMITSVPGSSVYFKGSIVCYSNEVKINQLGVEASLIDKYGAVSEQVVEKMAVNIREIMNTDYSIAVSGVAGPGGGSVEKPVGTTCIAVSSNTRTWVQKYYFGEHRGRNITRSSLTALNMLRVLILE